MFLTNFSANFELDNFELKVPHAGNKGLKEMADEVVNQTFVHLINSCGRLSV